MVKKFEEFNMNENIMSTQEVDLPDGEYKALWSGYHLEILSDEPVEIKTIDGVRGINQKKDILVKNRKVYHTF